MNKHLVFFASCAAVKEEPSTNNQAPGTSLWFQTFPPYGRYPVGGTIEGAAKDAEYVFDEKTAKRLMESFNAAKATPNWPGILVDREHFSLDPKKPSDAMAWAKDIRQEADGSLWTRWEFTPEGRELWNGKILVNRSPAFLAEENGKEYRPFELKSIGMTNVPHFDELSTLAAAKAAAEVNNNKGEIQMNEILKALDLAEGASEADAVAAINALKEKASAAEAKATDAEKAKDEAEGKCRQMECDAFVEANKAKIADVAACREVYMANPDAAKKLLGACKAVEAPKPQTILGAAKKTPTIEKTAAVGTCREQLAALPPSERAAFYQAHKAEIDAGE